MKISHWSSTSPDKANTSNTAGMTLLSQEPHGKVVTCKVTWGKLLNSWSEMITVKLCCKCEAKLKLRLQFNTHAHAFIMHMLLFINLLPHHRECSLSEVGWCCITKQVLQNITNYFCLSKRMSPALKLLACPVPLGRHDMQFYKMT